VTAKDLKPLTPREQAQVDAAVAKAVANAPKDLPDYVIERIATILAPGITAIQESKKRSTAA